MAALADVIDMQSHVAGYETELDLALKSQVQAEEQSLVAFFRVKDLETQVALLTDECSKLREELCLNQDRICTLESELGIHRGQEAEYSQAKSQVAELEKELEACRTVLEVVTVALDSKASEGDDFIDRVEELRSETQTVVLELEEVKVAKLLVENQLASTESELADVVSKFTDVDGEVRCLRQRLQEAVLDGLEKDRKLEVQKDEIDEIAHKLIQAGSLLSEEQGRAARLEEMRLQLEADVKELGAENFDLRGHMDTLQELRAAAEEYELLMHDLEQRFEVSTAEKAKLVDELHAQEVEKEERSREMEELTKQVFAGEVQIAVLTTHEVELTRRVESYNSRICSLEALLSKNLSDHEVERLALTSQIRDLEAQVQEWGGQNLRTAADLQELRDEVQYNLGEVEYEFQKHVIDTEARMVDLENQKKSVQTEALQLSARMSAENAKFAGMLGTLEDQVFDHRGKVRTWVENFNSLESQLLHLKNETVKFEGFDAQVKQLGKALEEEQKAGRDQKEEIVRLQTCLTEQVDQADPLKILLSVTSSCNCFASIRVYATWTEIEFACFNRRRRRIPSPGTVTLSVSRRSLMPGPCCQVLRA